MKIRYEPGPGRDALEKLVKALRKQNIDVGWFESAKYKNGTPVAYVAAIQEFGDTGNSIPPRPFMRPTIKKKKSSWQKLARNYAKAILRNENTPAEALTGIGLAVQADMQETITKIFEPKLADSTIAARRRRQANKSKNAPVSEKPLVDTGLMLSTLIHVVGSKK